MVPQPATSAATTGSSAVAACGQLSEAQFQTAMALFSGWWQESLPDQPPWVVQSVTLPVTQQLVQYLHLQRPVCSSATPAATQFDPGPSADSGPSQDAAAAAAAAAAAELHSLEQEDVALGMPALPTLQQQPQPSQQQPQPPQQQQQQQQVHVHQYSVVWHEIYQVPVLYLAASRQDGCPLTLPELCQDLPQLQHYQGDAAQASWTYISATAHPVTGAPCLMLHPCQTAARMQLLLQDQELPAQGSAGSPDALVPAASSSSAAAAGAELAAEASELLRYARGWFSMIVPLLGMSMLPL